MDDVVSKIEYLFGLENKKYIIHEKINRSSVFQAENDSFNFKFTRDLRIISLQVNDYPENDLNTGINFEKLSIVEFMRRKGYFLISIALWIRTPQLHETDYIFSHLVGAIYNHNRWILIDNYESGKRLYLNRLNDLSDYVSLLDSYKLCHVQYLTFFKSSDMANYEFPFHSIDALQILKVSEAEDQYSQYISELKAFNKKMFLNSRYTKIYQLCQEHSPPEHFDIAFQLLEMHFTHRGKSIQDTEEEYKKLIEFCYQNVQEFENNHIKLPNYDEWKKCVAIYLNSEKEVDEAFADADIFHKFCDYRVEDVLRFREGQKISNGQIIKNFEQFKNNH
jgi:hypothetical protein